MAGLWRRAIFTASASESSSVGNIFVAPRDSAARLRGARIPNASVSKTTAKFEDLDFIETARPGCTNSMVPVHPNFYGPSNQKSGRKMDDPKIRAMGWPQKDKRCCIFLPTFQ